MDESSYLGQMGITAARRAFFSYTVKPEGSYGLHIIFRKFVKDKKIVIEKDARERWNAFFTDYLVLRLYVARYVLKRYASEYTPLIALYKGFDKVEEKFPLFLLEEARPGRGIGDMALIPEKLDERYGPASMEELHHLFDRIASEAEGKYADPRQALSSFLHLSITELYHRNEVNPNTPVVWFFEEEAKAYARYLTGFYGGLIPAEFYETVKFRPYQRQREEEHIRRVNWKLSAAILLIIAMAFFAVLVLAGT